MVRIICVSDTHSLHEAVTIPPGEILIHAGDHCNHGTSGEVKRFDRWLGTLPHPHKIIIAGNHDLPWHRRPRYARLWLHHARYLQDQAAEVQGFKIWGSPWQPDFPQWAFYQQRNSPELGYIWDKIPDDTQNSYHPCPTGRHPRFHDRRRPRWMRPTTREDRQT